MIPPTYKAKKKFTPLAIAEAKCARDRGDYPIGAVITRLIGKREVVIASAGNRVRTCRRMQLAWDNKQSQFAVFGWCASHG
jgi:tRNA(Arg) A34 adenosine deaminase TadA